MVNQSLPTNPTNRASLISLIAALLTVISFCIAVAPIPLTGFVCYPAAAFFGLIAILTGLTSLWQLRSSGGNGRVFAMLGVGVGALAMIAALCATTLGIMLTPQIMNFLRQIPR